MNTKLSRLLRGSIVAVSLGVSAFANAVIVSGKVLDDKGMPVSGATIQIEGTNQTATTQADGSYQIKLSEKAAKAHIHIHVYSANHLHGDKDLGFIVADQSVNFTLSPVVFENVRVTASALGTSVLESITPVTVLSADTLRKRQAPTLGETLKMTPGVHSTYYAGVASSPIIRGNDGPRVKIVQNGLDVSDVSRVGPDHAVASDASSATQVEVLRGPATLQYGSGAIGGVVNIVDKRIPSYLELDATGEAEVRYASVNNEKFAKLDVTASAGSWAFHADGFTRKTNDIDIPGFAQLSADDDDEFGVIDGSSVDTNNGVVGVSYIGNEGYIGLSVQRLNNFYGVPGHAHGHGEAEAEDERVNIDAGLNRYQLDAMWHSPFNGITSIELSGAYSEYEHSEIEGQELGTQFSNDSTEVRLDFTHADFAGWHGVFGVQLSTGDYVAMGEEAFTPPAKTDNYSLYLIEETQVGNVTWQVGARVERNKFEASDTIVTLATGHAGEHHEEEQEEHHGSEEEHHNEEVGALEVSFEPYTFTAYSTSLGANWHYDENSSIALSLSRSERAPSQQELFSGGAHLATQTYEVGLAFDIDDDGDIMGFDAPAENEISQNIDITWRKFHSDWGISASVFYSDIADYIYQRDIGLEFMAEHDEHDDEHEEGHEEEGHTDEHDEGLPVLVFNQADSTLYGFEFDSHIDLNSQWRVSLFGDYIRAKIDNDNLPRIPPLRMGSSVEFQYQNWESDVEVVWYDAQRKTATYEAPTDGYTLVNAGLLYRKLTDNLEWTLFARVENLFDTEARVHTSFLKSQAPLPGRNIQMGIRVQF